jgi:hypothetical protein
MRRCDAILSTAIGCASIGALGGVVLAHEALQMLVYAAIGVWGGAFAGGLLGALRYALFHERGEPSKKLRPAGL